MVWTLFMWGMPWYCLGVMTGIGVWEWLQRRNLPEDLETLRRGYEASMVHYRDYMVRGYPTLAYPYLHEAKKLQRRITSLERRNRPDPLGDQML